MQARTKALTSSPNPGRGQGKGGDGMQVVKFVNTSQPSSARRMDMARPLPIPSPRHPAPVTMATFPLNERDGGSDGTDIPGSMVMN